MIERLCKLQMASLPFIPNLVWLSKKQKMENLESDSEGPKKRKKEDQQGSLLKRKRVGNRENSRMKESPAGNIATSSVRIAFLQSFCNLPKFQEMVDLVPMVVSLYLFRTLVIFKIFKFQPKDSSILPSWASWKSQETFLPARFHTLSSFNKNLSIAKKGF